MVHVALAAALRLPAASRACTVNVCAPVASGPGRRLGLVHGTVGASSSRQTNVVFASAPSNENVALPRGARSRGRDVITGGGGAVASIVQRYVAAALSLPAASTAVAANACSPSAKPLAPSHDAG